MSARGNLRIVLFFVILIVSALIIGALGEEGLKVQKNDLFVKYPRAELIPYSGSAGRDLYVVCDSGFVKILVADVFYNNFKEQKTKIACQPEK